MEKVKVVIDCSGTKTLKTSHKKAMAEGFAALILIQIAWFCLTVSLVSLGGSSLCDRFWKAVFTNFEITKGKKKKLEVLLAIKYLSKARLVKSSTEKEKKINEKKYYTFCENCYKGEWNNWLDD